MLIQSHSITFTNIADASTDYASVTYSTIIAGEPPVSIWIGVVKLNDVFRFMEPAKNNQWINHVTPEANVMVTINATGTMIECNANAIQAINVHRPICQLHGHNYAKRIACSNGQTYKNQSEAAYALGLNQGAISAALNGRLKTVKGYKFTYTA